LRPEYKSRLLLPLTVKPSLSSGKNDNPPFPRNRRNPNEGTAEPSETVQGKSETDCKKRIISRDTYYLLLATYPLFLYPKHMQTNDISLEKSKTFAIRIVGLYKHLCSDKKEFVMSKQILRSGTSIGANLSEATYAISRKEFLAKKYIALKECSETEYWLELLHNTAFLTDTEYDSMLADCQELLKMLIAATKTLRVRSKE
jgi:four helix bundle protein